MMINKHVILFLGMMTLLVSTVIESAELITSIEESWKNKQEISKLQEEISNFDNVDFGHYLNFGCMYFGR